MPHSFQRIVFTAIGHLLNLDRAFARGKVSMTFGRPDGYQIAMNIDVPLFYSEGSTIDEIHEMAYDAVKRCLLDAAEIVRDNDLTRLKSMTLQFERDGPPALRPDAEEESGIIGN